VNKTELVEFISQQAGGSKAEAERYLNLVLEGLETGVKKSGSVTLVGFGSFKKTKRSAREGRNPRTGEKIQIPAANQVKFSPGSKLKEAVN
jgi:DNA-binding protein HU-beta